MRKTIRVSEQTHREVKTLSKSLNLELGNFVEHSIAYFKATGIDPRKDDIESPYKAAKELEKRLGQIVAFIKTQEQEKLNPLFEQLIFLTRKLDEALQKLPTSERFDQVIKGVNYHSNLLVENHKKQMNILRESQQKMDDENRQELAALSKALTSFKEGLK